MVPVHRVLPGLSRQTIPSLFLELSSRTASVASRSGTHGLEACGAAHYWARELTALGHEVVLLPPQYVKPYVKRNKNDSADAEAICEAMSRPTMRFVPVKSAEQQAALMLVGMRAQLVRRRTQLSNTIRGDAAEFGLVAAKGLCKIEPLLNRAATDKALPRLAKNLFAELAKEYAQLEFQLRKIEARLMSLAPLQ